MKGSNVKIYIKKKSQLLQIIRVHFGKGKIKKEEHKHKYSVRQHYVAASCLAAFNMADLSKRPCSLRWKGPRPVSKRGTQKDFKKNFPLELAWTLRQFPFLKHNPLRNKHETKKSRKIRINGQKN